MTARETVSSALRAIFSPPRTARLPITSNDLLTAIISWTLTTHPTPKDRLKLTDLKTLEDLLVEFAQTWEHGTIIIGYDKSAQIAHRLVSQVTVEDIQVNAPLAKKRKHRENSGEPETPVSQTRSEVLDAHHISHDLRQVYMMLQRGTAKGKLLAEQFKSKDSSAFDPICPYVTKDECIKARRASLPPNAHAEPQRWRQGQQWVPPVAPVTFCEKVHFRALIRPHTDPSLGHCSYLNTCYSEPTYAQSPSIPPPPSSSNPNAGRIGNMNAVSLPSGLGAGGRGKEKAPCRYLHFEVDYDGFHGEGGNPGTTTIVPITSKGNSSTGDDVALGIGLGPTGQISKTLTPAQWINCDVRRFDYSVLGKFHVIMADPPWDIHMSLPYGTMTDDEMRAMPIPTLQDEGVIFLWVTGRAMEVGRECLRVWGYTRVDEVVWLKTNQLQRVIRTGRTGHWLNHTKEHMLVGLKTNLDEDGNLKWPSWLNRGLDVDVIVSEVRETSRKPDEVYGVIERMCPGGRKLEIFGRKHNIRPGWLTLGNQLGQDQIHEEDMAERIRARYPERFIGRQM